MNRSFLKVVGTQVFEKPSRGGTVADQVVLITGIRKSPPLN